MSMEEVYHDEDFVLIDESQSDPPHVQILSHLTKALKGGGFCPVVEQLAKPTELTTDITEQRSSSKRKTIEKKEQEEGNRSSPSPRQTQPNMLRDILRNFQFQADRVEEYEIQLAPPPSDTSSTSSSDIEDDSDDNKAPSDKGIRFTIKDHMFVCSFLILIVGGGTVMWSVLYPQQMDSLGIPPTLLPIVAQVAVCFMMAVAQSLYRHSLSFKEEGTSIYVHEEETPTYNSCKSLEEEMNSLPDITTWKYANVYPVVTHGRLIDQPGTTSIPLGTPFEFESVLFKGKALMRFRDTMSDDKQSHDAFFTAMPRALCQFVIQGQFKEELDMKDVYVGDSYESPLSFSPPKWLESLINTLLRTLVPGIILELSSEKPRLGSRIGSACHTISIDEPGEEPDIRMEELPENTVMSHDMQTSEVRKRMLSQDDSDITFDPNKIYTFQIYDEHLNLTTFKYHLPLGKELDMISIMNGHPLSISASTKDGRYAFAFRCWNKRTVEQRSESNAN